jgi:hypothetical protein
VAQVFPASRKDVNYLRRSEISWTPPEKKAGSEITQYLLVFVVGARAQKAIQLRVEAQDFANHNNVAPFNTLVNNLVGSQVNGTQFVNKSYSRATDGRNVRLWAKCQF